MTTFLLVIATVQLAQFACLVGILINARNTNDWLNSIWLSVAPHSEQEDEQ